MNNTKIGSLFAVILSVLLAQSVAEQNGHITNTDFKNNEDPNKIQLINKSQNLLNVFDTMQTTKETLDKINAYYDDGQYYIGDAFDIVVYNETRGDKGFWNKNDGGAPSAGGFQFNLRKGYPFHVFINYLKTNAVAYYDMLESAGGTTKALKNDPKYIEVFQKLCREDEKFYDLMKNFAFEYIYTPKLNVMNKKYGLDISNRHEVVKGIIYTFIGNRGIEFYDVIEKMIKYSASIKYKVPMEKVSEEMMTNIVNIKILNRFSDEAFTKMFEQMAVDVVENSYILTKYKKGIKNNLRHTLNAMVYPNMKKEVISVEQRNLYVRVAYDDYIETLFKKFNLNDNLRVHFDEILFISMETASFESGNINHKSIIKNIEAVVRKLANKDNIYNINPNIASNNNNKVKSNRDTTSIYFEMLKYGEFISKRRELDIDGDKRQGLLAMAERYLNDSKQMG